MLGFPLKNHRFNAVQTWPTYSSLCSLGSVKDKLKEKPKQKDFLRIKLKKKRRRKKAKFGKSLLPFGFHEHSAVLHVHLLSLWKWLACEALSTPVGVVVELLCVGKTLLSHCQSKAPKLPCVPSHNRLMVVVMKSQILFFHILLKRVWRAHRWGHYLCHRI